MADLVIDGGAAVLRKTFVIHRGTDAAHLMRHLFHNPVNGKRIHSLMNFLRHRIEAGHVDFGGFLDFLYILRCLDQLSGWHDATSLLISDDLLVKSLMAFFVFFSASAPARCIAQQPGIHESLSSFCKKEFPSPIQRMTFAMI